ncbi:hypothetical protein [Nocardioides albus]|uniref:Ig-like domain-containing protein n=1 Tax=Nocardioides albus TaxID=1841 RepID=A0A7W5A1U6_9ACTN|nr:hypothetical protein [Nocardioides albus]MBB3087936.1 hypothetical protein [Nocardioides albus]GGU21433.1 hypothetical protein GCM10007979_20030 [Nocardioides albus]
MSRRVARLVLGLVLAVAVLSVPAAVTTPSAEAACRPALKSLTLARSTVAGGTSTSATIRLTCRTPRRAKVQLWASPGIRVPAYAYVAGGRSTRAVTVRTSPTTVRSSGRVKAVYRQVVRRATLVRTATACYPTPVPTAVTLPAYVHAGQRATGTVTLDCVARTSLAVSVTSSSSLVTVPGTLTIQAGRRTASFTAVTKAPVVGTLPAFNVTIRATRNGKSAARTMQVRPEIRPFRAGDRFTVNEPILTPEGTDGWVRGTLRITLDHPAPPGGLDVNGLTVPEGTTWTEVTIHHNPYPPDSRVTDHLTITDSSGTVVLREDFTYSVHPAP